jgi:hypothetical protein
MALQHGAAYQIAALCAGVLGFLLIMLGAVLTYTASLDVGIVTAVGGLVPTAAGGLLFGRAGEVERRTADSLEKLTVSIRQSEAVLQVVQIGSRISDERTRERIFGVVALQAAFPTANVNELAAVLSAEVAVLREAAEELGRRR